MLQHKILKDQFREIVKRPKIIKWESKFCCCQKLDHDQLEIKIRLILQLTELTKEAACFYVAA